MAAKRMIEVWRQPKVDGGNVATAMVTAMQQHGSSDDGG
jgi:hypothetical protein